MNYNQEVFNQAVETISRRKLPAIISRDNNVTWECSVVIGYPVAERKVFVTPKLAKIYLEDYLVNDSISSDRSTSGLVGQKNDEVILKRRGRPKKADNDRTRRI